MKMGRAGIYIFAMESYGQHRSAPGIVWGPVINDISKRFYWTVASIHTDRPPGRPGPLLVLILLDIFI